MLNLIDSYICLGLLPFFYCIYDPCQANVVRKYCLRLRRNVLYASLPDMDSYQRLIKKLQPKGDNANDT